MKFQRRHRDAGMEQESGAPDTCPPPATHADSASPWSPSGSHTPSRDYHALVAAVERSWLDHGKPVPFQTSRQAGSRAARRGLRLSGQWHRITGRTGAPSDDPQALMTAVLAGLARAGHPVPFLICGTKDGIRICCGDASPGQADAQAVSLIADTLNCAVESKGNTEEAPQLSWLARRGVRVAGMSGYPAGSTPSRDPLDAVSGAITATSIERLRERMRGTTWAMLVLANPVNAKQVDETFDAITREISKSSRDARTSFQSNQSETMTISGEVKHRPVDAYIDLLESALNCLALGKGVGMWRVAAYLLAPDDPSLCRLASVARSVFGYTREKPEPFHVFSYAEHDLACQAALSLKFPQSDSSRRGSPLGELFDEPCLAVLDSQCLASLVALPLTEIPGFSVTPCVPFSTNPNAGDGGLVIGNVIDRGQPLDTLLRVPLPDLDKHALIAGMTGGGKTNTCMHLLVNLNATFDIPFLVIEPAKAEYRTLMLCEDLLDLRVFTLGDETTAPFRLNPFEVMPGVGLQTHIDNLNAVFNASFNMFPPMPYVLERCIHEVYWDKGWDPVTTQNVWWNGSGPPPPELYPTLTDLHNKVDPVVAQLGYDKRIASDLRAALRARIGSLLTGEKGLLLDCPKSIPIDELLRAPTVVELRRIGQDDEKAFLIGLLLMRIYQHLEYNVGRGDLRHVILIEEAHRLLSRVEGGGEANAGRAQAVETFVNILAEVRAYGEGVLIAEQVPTKLASEVTKNSNLKIMHRLVAQDDRTALASAMSMSDEQSDFVANLRKGQAIVHAEHLHAPVWVQVPRFKGVSVPDEDAVTDAAVRDRMRAFYEADAQLRRPFPGCVNCKSVCTWKALAARAVQNSGIALDFYLYFTGCVANPDRFALDFERLHECIVTAYVGSPLDRDQRDGFVRCCLAQASHRLFQSVRRRNKLSFEYQRRLEEGLWKLFEEVLAQWGRVEPAALKKELQATAAAYGRQYARMAGLPNGPFPTCAPCRSACYFRETVEQMAGDPQLIALFRKLLEGSAAPTQFRTLAEKTMSAAFRRVSATVHQDAVLCCLGFWTRKARVKDPARFVARVLQKKPNKT